MYETTILQHFCLNEYFLLLIKTTLNDFYEQIASQARDKALRFSLRRDVDHYEIKARNYFNSMNKAFLIFIIGFLNWNCEFNQRMDKSNAMLSFNAFEQDKSFARGKTLFKENCVACHHIGMHKIKTAPALGGITKKRAKEWLYNYTRNSIEMFKNGDSIAIEIRNQGWALMNSFPNLTDKNLDEIYYFVEKQYELTKQEPNK